jgi:hypothetical protein
MHSFPDIIHLKATLDQDRPLDPAIVRNLREELAHLSPLIGASEKGRGIT